MDVLLNARRARYIAQPYFKRRVRGSSTMTGRFGMRNIEGYTAVCTRMRALGEEHPEWKTVIGKYLSYILNDVIWAGHRMSLLEKVETACRFQTPAARKVRQFQELGCVLAEKEIGKDHESACLHHHRQLQRAARHLRNDRLLPQPRNLSAIRNHRCGQRLAPARGGRDTGTIQGQPRTGRLLIRQPRLLSPVKVVRNINNGFAGGNDAGLKAAEGDYLFFINNDTLIKEPVLDALVRRIESDSRRNGGVSPMLKFAARPDTLQYAGFTP